MRQIFASFALLFAACGGSPLDPGAGNDPGTGTNTLLVTGRASAEPKTPNAIHDTDFTTDISVRVSLNNVPVTMGTVSVKSRTGTAMLTFTNDGQGGHWDGSLANYDEVYELSVVSGADKVEGVYVDGPDIHVFTKPTAGASIDSTMMTPLAWDRAITAQTATLRVTDGGDGLTISDSGSYMIPPATFKAEKDQSKPATIRLTRSNSVTPRGAVGGSTFSVSIANELDVVVLANPLLP